MDTKVFKVKNSRISLVCIITVFIIGGYIALYMVGHNARTDEQLYRTLGILTIPIFLFLNFFIFRVTTIEITPDKLLLKRILGKTNSYNLADIDKLTVAIRKSHFVICFKSGNTKGYNAGSLGPKVVAEMVQEVNERLLK